MAWVGVEEDSELRSIVAATVGGVVGLAVWRYADFWSGLFAYVAAGGIAMVTCDLWLAWRLPTEARSAAERVRTWFREQFPGLRIERVGVRAIEPERYVIVVRYSEPRVISYPGARLYFGVRRSDDGEIAELPTEDWWPRGLK